MKRLATIVALFAALILPLRLRAQSRAAPLRVPAFRTARIGGGSVAPRPTYGPFRTRPVRPVRTGEGPFRPAPDRDDWDRFGPQPFSRPQFTFVAPLFFPYLYPSSPADEEQAPGPAEESAAPGRDDSLANQVANLTDEVEDLRQQQESQESTQSEAPPEAEPETAVPQRSAPAVFVYRDGQQFEAQNYAVLGQTLWIYEDDTARKIPLAQLDLDQTRKLNDERGIDFSGMH